MPFPKPHSIAHEQQSTLERPEGQVAPFHNRRANPVLVRVPEDDLGYDLRDFWWGVPPTPGVLLSIDFCDLGVIDFCPERFL